MRGSVQALRTISFPNQRTFFPLASFLSLCWLLQPGFAQPPSPQDLSHKAARSLNRSPSSASSRPRRPTPSASLPPSGPHSRASTGGSVFLGTTCMHLHVSPQGLGRRPTHLRALLRLPAGPTPEAEPAPPRLAAQSAALPVLLTKAV